MKPSNNLENKTLSDTYWRVQLVCKKIQAHSSLEPPLEYNQDQMRLTNQDSVWPFEPSWELRKYSFRLVLEGQTGKEVSESSRLELLEKFSIFFVEGTISNSLKVTRARFLGSDGFFCFISICKFGNFKNPFTTITSLSWIRRFILLVQTKTRISMNYDSSKSSWKPWRWVRLDLIFSRRDI